MISPLLILIQFLICAFLSVVEREACSCLFSITIIKDVFRYVSFKMFPSGLILLTRCKTTEFPEFLRVVKIPQVPIVFWMWQLEVLTPHNGRLARCQSCGVRKARKAVVGSAFPDVAFHICMYIPSPKLAICLPSRGVFEVMVRCGV